MAEKNLIPQTNTTSTQTLPLPVNSHKHILEQSLGDILQNNPQAQKIIMQSMGISQEKFQQMVTSVQQNNMMHMKISDLFKSGIVNQAVSQYQGKIPHTGQAHVISQGPVQFVQNQQVQLTPEQLRQVQNGTISPQQLLKQYSPVEKKTSFMDKMKNWFK